MTIRKFAIGAAALLVGLPLAALLVAVSAAQVLDRSNGTLVSRGREREYLLHVPSSYDPTRPTSLVVSLHAGWLWPASQMKTSRWNDIADEHGFLVVYPAGTRVPKGWHITSEAALAEDVAFISALIDSLEAAYNLDPARIYADGFSNGGGMAFALSCRLSHRIAAIGSVAAAQVLPWSACADSGPVPTIAFHGTADRIVPYQGGRSLASRAPLPSIPAWVAARARRNRCGAGPVESVVAADVVRVDYGSCAEDAAVVLYTIEGGGHAWPGGRPWPEWLAGPTSRSIEATRLIWAFFGEHALGPDRQRPGRGR